MKKTVWTTAISLLLCMAVLCGCGMQPAQQAVQKTHGAGGTTAAGEHAPAVLTAGDLPGVWRNTTDPHFLMTITHQYDDMYYVTIIRSDDTTTIDRWEIMGEYDIWYLWASLDEAGGRLVCDGGASRTAVYNDGENFSEEPVYDSGNGQLTFVDGKLSWLDEQENMGENSLFERVADLPDEEMDWEEDPEEQSDVEPADLPPGGEKLLGEWIDTVSQRATMTVEWTGDGFYVVIHWADSAFEASEWRMTGQFEDAPIAEGEEPGSGRVRIRSNDCDLYRIESGEDYEMEEAVYLVGEATLTWMNDVIYWYDAQEDAGADCVFERIK